MQKLVALLHLKVPPEIHLSKARASVLRVTLVFPFGVPQISIEVDGIQVQARLVEEEHQHVGKPPSNSRASARSPPPRPPTSPPLHRDDLSDTSDDEHVPTLEDLTKSFLRAEPTEEIRELEQELESRSEYMHESAASSDDGSDEDSAGMGAPLALPNYLRNILNTALDRLSIMINNIDVEVQDQDIPDASTSIPSSPASLNFHIERVVVDSITSQDTHVELGSTGSRPDTTPDVGKRRLRVENICARLVSDAENFVSMSRVSQPAPPSATRSTLSSGLKAPSEPSENNRSLDSLRSSILGQEPAHPGESQQLSASVDPALNASAASVRDEASVLPAAASPEQSQLNASVHTVDHDRFADVFDDGELEAPEDSSPSQSLQSLPSRDLGGSSILYDDEGVLDYAMQNDMLNSRFDDAFDPQSPEDIPENWDDEADNAVQQSYTSTATSDASTANLPTVSALGRSFQPPIDQPSPSASIASNPPASTDNLVAAQHQAEEEHETLLEDHHSSPASSPRSDQDLAESQLFTHDEAESMYMSAVGVGQAESTHRHVPGGWDSTSTSSKDTASDTSGSIPENMIAGSILAPHPEVDDGCETPRPGSPLSTIPSPHLNRARTPTAHSPVRKQAKLILTIDEVTVWFPLGFEDEDEDKSAAASVDASGISFKAPNLGEDSIFAEMPGSFSNYAHTSTHRRNPSLEASARRRPVAKDLQAERSVPTEKRASAPSIIVQVGSIAGHMDLSTGRVMYGMFTRVLAAFVTGSGAHETAPKQGESQKDVQTSAFDISVKDIGISWLDNVMTESFIAESSTTRMLTLGPGDAILRLSCQTIRMTSQIRPQDSRTKLQFGKFVLASLDQNLVSFENSRPRSRRSAGAQEQLSNDVEIDYEQAKDKRITVVTRPVQVTLDIQKLDEALGCFGGFSGVLELSSSISSTNTTINSPVISPSRPRPRGVHFGDIPPARTEVRAPSSSPKVQVQFGEVAVTLKGRSCAVKVQTTTVRVAMRESNIRVKVSEVHFSGPYSDTTQVCAPLSMDIQGTTVNFLFGPEESDLARLISMITPSKDPYENNDDILIDTLLRQRRKGSVLRVEVTNVVARLSDLQELKTFEALGNEIARLSKVTKYLPDDDRPGLLTLASVQHLEAGIAINEQLGDVKITLEAAAVAHVGVPALLATEVGQATITRGDEVLVHEVIPLRPQDQLPAIMIRMVGDEMEPVVKAKLFNVCAEYRVSTVMAALGISDDGTVDDIALGIAASVATITGASSAKSLSRQTSQASSPASPTAKPLQVDLLMRNCALGLNPRKITSKGLFVLTEAHIAGKQARSEYNVTLELRRASMHAIDDVARLDEEREQPPATRVALPNLHLHELREVGFVSLSSISAAKVLVNIAGDGEDEPQLVDVEFKNDLFVLESCADSTQTLIAIINGLQPPTPPSTAERYRNVVPLQEMMESFTGDAFAAPELEDVEDDFMSNADLVDDEVPTNLEFVGSIYNSQSLPSNEEMGDSLLGEDDLDALAHPPIIRQRGDRALLESFQEKYEVSDSEQGFVFDEHYFKDSDTEGKGKARKWDSEKNQYHLSNEFKQPDAPLKIRVRDVNIIWNLYDGYDWPRTRDAISQAVDDVEARADERRRKTRDEDEEDDFVEEDFLFNSVWIGVPVKDDKGALARRINHDIDDLASETGSYATSTATRSTGATARPRSSEKTKRRLKLDRSKHKKVAFSLMGVAVDLIVFPPDSGETINSIDVRIRDLEIFDHVPTSTWKKFLTCLIEPNAREMHKPMINLDLLTVKPVTDLAASELVIKVTVLPLRLHVDQDCLDFITRFFEFKDDSAAPSSSSSASEEPFIQRLEIKAVRLKLDYKPKRVDYRGLRSGHTTEFMNFLILDGSDIILRHAIVYGITSFDKLHKTLNDVWMPDVKRNQLPGVLAGLAAVRPLVNVGSGMRDLVVVPMREYRKDGRIVRSLQKGVYAFAKNTTSEVARLGAKVAIGTQTLLEGAEAFLAPQSSPFSSSLPTTTNTEIDDPRATSNYAHQPIGVRAGLRSAAAHLERDLLTARDAVIAIPGEVMETGSGVGVARALARYGPTVILRPAVGGMKAVSSALLGVGNALDGGSRRKIDDVSTIFHAYVGSDCGLRVLTRFTEIQIVLRLAVEGAIRDHGFFCWDMVLIWEIEIVSIAMEWAWDWIGVIYTLCLFCAWHMGRNWGSDISRYLLYQD